MAAQQETGIRINSHPDWQRTPPRRDFGHPALTNLYRVSRAIHDIQSFGRLHSLSRTNRYTAGETNLVSSLEDEYYDTMRDLLHLNQSGQLPENANLRLYAHPFEAFLHPWSANLLTISINDARHFTRPYLIETRWEEIVDGENISTHTAIADMFSDEQVVYGSDKAFLGRTFHELYLLKMSGTNLRRQLHQCDLDTLSEDLRGLLGIVSDTELQIFLSRLLPMRAQQTDEDPWKIEVVRINPPRDGNYDQPLLKVRAYSDNLRKPLVHRFFRPRMYGISDTVLEYTDIWNTIQVDSEEEIFNSPYS